MVDDNVVIGNKLDEIRDLLNIEQHPKNNLNTIDFAWFVGATGWNSEKKWHDFSDEYISQGIWRNGYDNKFIDVVKSFKPGDYIAIKSTFTQKRNLPFNNNGKVVGAMRIKAIGVVKENEGDGQNILVDWHKLEPARTWYGPGVLRETVHNVNANDSPTRKQLLDFTFLGIEQDYSVCEEYYADVVTNPIIADDNTEDEEPIFPILPSEQEIFEEKRITNGSNIILYGVPGSGKSWTIEHEYCHPDSIVERLVFHPDYTNADFIGQILPVVDANRQVSYEFSPGPFTTIVREAYRNPMCEYILIIEEMNRGNAAAIFGDVFQLLDRAIEPKTENGVTYPVGTSEYGITNKYMAEQIYGNPSHKVRIPANLSIIGTMNTSDQNVYTLDTAFQRRWMMRLIENDFKKVRSTLANAEILDTKVTWKTFCEKINDIIVGNKAKMASAEDKRLGVYFIHESDLALNEEANPSEGYASLSDEYEDLSLKEVMNNSMTEEEIERLASIRKVLIQYRKFPEKVIKYLWDDAFKFNLEALFDTEQFQSLEQVILTFAFSREKERFQIFKKTVQELLYSDNQQGN